MSYSHKFLVVMILGTTLLTACQSPPTITQRSTNPLVTTITIASPVPEFSTVPGPTLFNYAWDDFSIYEQGLVPSRRQALTTLTDAPIYHIAIELDETLTSLTGQEDILYTNREISPLDEIYLRLFPNHFLNPPVTITDLVINQESIEPQFQLADTALYVPLPTTLLPGEHVVMQFNFSMSIPKIEESPFSLFGFGDGILALDQFYPSVIVFDEEGWSLEDPPQWEESGYTEAGFFLIRVTLPDDQVVIASGVEIERETQSGQQTLTFAAGPARGFSLVSGPGLERISQTVGDTTLYSYSPPNLAPGAQDALKFAANALVSFNERLGEYPYTEFEMVSTPLTASGSASPGVVVINRSYYEGDNVFDIPALNNLERTVAHEFAHQWFYNLVDNDYSNELWFAEGFAQYMTSLYYLDVYGADEQQIYIQDWTARWSEAGNKPIPIGLPVQEYGSGEVRAIIYGRGPLFIQTLSQEIGEQNFDSFLQDFLQIYQWELTSGEQFKQMAEGHCTCDLTPLFDEWVYANPNLQTAQEEETDDGPKIILDPGVPFETAQDATDFQLLSPVYFPQRFEFYGVSLLSRQEAAMNYLQSEPAPRLAVLVQTVVGANSEFNIFMDTQNAQTVMVNGVEAIWIYDAVSNEGLLDWTTNGIRYRLVGIIDLEEALQIAESLE